jgi:hypothetical protein
MKGTRLSPLRLRTELGETTAGHNAGSIRRVSLDVQKSLIAQLGDSLRGGRNDGEGP